MIKLHDKLAEIRAAREEGEKGFTLIELLVVVIIIGILAAIAIPIFLGQQAQARDSAAKSAITNAKTQIVAYTVEDGTPPTTAEATAIAIAAAGDTDITITATVDSTDGSFCVQASHSAGTGTFSATEESGVRTGGC